VNGFGHPTVERDLFLTLVLIENLIVEIVILTFGQLSRSSGLDSCRNCEPFAPAVDCAPRNVEVLFYPCGEPPVGVGKVIACALSAELLAEVIEQWSQVLLSKLLMFLPDRLDCSFEFVLVQFPDFRIGIGGIGRVASMRVWSRRLR